MFYCLPRVLSSEIAAIHDGDSYAYIQATYYHHTMSVLL